MRRFQLSYIRYSREEINLLWPLRGFKINRRPQTVVSMSKGKIMLGASRDLFTYYFICRPKSQILTLTAEATKQCTRFKEGDQSDLDLLHSMEQIFKSQACLNGSFLLSQDKHFSCSSRNYGVDLKAAQMAFDNLRKVENQSIKQVVSGEESMIMLRILSHELLTF